MNLFSIYRSFLYTLFLVPAVCLLISCSGDGSVPSRPNIIFIMSDDHGYQALSAYGSKLIKTPHIDRLAKEGVIFTQAFVTNSICSPSRAALLTGKFSHKNKLYINRNGYNRFDSSQVTFPRLLQKAGYQTAIIGKWHLKSRPVGFDYWNILPGQGQYYNPEFIEMGEEKQIPGYVTTLISDFAIRWLEDRNSDKPFCLLVHEKAPHRPWIPDTTTFTLFREENFPIPENYFDNYEGRRGAKEQKMSIISDMDLAYDLKMIDRENEINTPYRHLLERMLARMSDRQRAAWDREYEPKIEAFKKADLAGRALAVWKLRRYLTDYLRCIASIDSQIGRILDYLDASGLSENTIVVYTSDQGFFLGEHGYFDKRYMYEESFRTPLLMRYPGFRRKGKITELVQNIDFAPTVLDFADVPVPAEMQGMSIKPLLMNERPPSNWRKALYYHYYEYPGEHGTRRHYGIRTKRYKLIHFYYDFDEWELFDLKTDPYEMQNLYTDPEYNTLRNNLKMKLDSLRVVYGDTLPDPDYISQ